ncbi:MAG: YggT family protein [bacterium]|nr:YggT family protein [bacterium]
MIVLGIIDVYVLVIVVYCILTWFPDGNEKLVQVRDVLGKMCEPYLKLFRKIIPAVGGFDFSPIVAILVLQLIARLLF